MFWHNQAYPDIFRHNHSYSGIMQAYSDIQTFSDLCNYGILRTLTHLEPEAY